MARPLRIEYAGAIYHVTARGNERRPIFRSDADRRRFQKKLCELCAVHHVEVYAYAQMTNHYHLVVCTPRGNLTAFMQQFQTSYTMDFNRRYGRIGHLFAGRYKSPLVEGGHYLLRLTRYVHLNPAKTKQARALDFAAKLKLLHEFPWSSLRGYSGLGPVEDWVTCKALEAFGDAGVTARQRKEYLRFVEEGIEEDDDAFLETLRKSSKACGSDAFCRAVEGRFRDRTASLDRFVDVAMRRRETPVPVEEVTAAVMSAYGVSAEGLLRRGNREAKDFWVRLLHEAGGLSQREVGRLVGHCDGTTVSRCLSRLASVVAGDSEANERYQALRARITNSKA